MLEFFHNLLFPREYIPNGHCYLWQTNLLWLHVVSDLMTALAYYSIPLMLLYFVRQRQEVPFKGIFVLFSAFIITCSTTHLLEIWTLWHPAYWLLGFVKLLTGLVSIYTAIELFPVIPQALALPNPAQLEATNRALKQTNEQLQFAQFCLDRSADAIFWFNSDSQIFYVNEAATKTLGYTREELLSMKTWDINPNYREDDWEQNWNQFKSIESAIVESTHRTKEGKIIPVEINSNYLEFNGQEYSCCFARDISDRKIAEAALSQKTETLAKFSAHLQQLHRITTTQYQTLEELFADYIKTGYEILGLSTGIIGEVEGETFITRAVKSEFDFLEPGMEFPLKDIYCTKVIQAKTTLSFTHIGSIEDMRELPLYQNLKLETYIGAPIFVNNSIWGTLSFISTEMVDRDFEEYQKKIIELIARGIGNSITTDLTTAALSESEEKFRAIVEGTTLPFLISRFDDGKVLYGNSLLCSTFGISPEKIIGIKTPNYYYNPADRQIILEKIATVGYLHPYELQAKKADGTSFWVILSCRRIIFQGEDALLATLYDISDRKQMEEALQESEERYRSLYQKTPVMLHSIDRDGNLISVSDYWLEKLGYEIDEVIGRKSIDFLTPESRSHAVEIALPEYYRRGFCQHIPYQMVKKNGEIIDVLLSAIAERDERGNILRSLAVSIDITDRRRAELALEETQHLIQKITDTLPNLIYIYDLTKQQNIYTNRFVVEILGYSTEEFKKMGSDLSSEIFHPQDLSKIVDYHQKIARTKDKDDFEIEYRIRNATGDWQWFYSRDTVFAKDDRGYPTQILGAAIDITDRKRSETQLQILNEELLRSNQELERFAYIASHDLREPLRMVTNFTQVLGKRYSGKLDEDADQIINFAVDGAKRMDALIQDLLNYSRVGKAEKVLEITDCEVIFDETLSNLQLLIQETGTIVTRHPLPKVMAYPAQLTLLFQNLIDNAIKYRSNKPPEINIGAKLNGNKWLFWVRDNGIGIDPKYFERIFFVFQRLHTIKDYPGTGIGLAICQKIVDLHQGEIWVNSEVGKGSTFYFTIPRIN